MRRIWRWPARAALQALREQLKTTAAEHYHREFVRWALIAPYAKEPRPRAPDVPRILRS